MRFKLSKASSFNSPEDEAKYERLGFRYGRTSPGGWWRDITDEVTGPLAIEISSLEELMHFINEYGAVIIDRESITIYDNYVE